MVITNMPRDPNESRELEFMERPTKFYNFHKTPDGEDCLEKTYYYTKYAGIAGAVVSVYEMVIVSKPRTYPAGIARFGRLTVPAIGMGFVFGTSLCLLGKLRKKDVWTNHFIAGAISGTVWGAKFGSISTGHTVALVAGAIAAYFKYFEQHKIPYFVTRRPETRMALPSWDWTIKLYDDPGRPDEA